VRTLSEEALLANILAWRALGALAVEDVDMAGKASQNARSLAPNDAAVLFVAGQVQVLIGLAEPGLATMERAAGIRADGQTWFALGVMAAEANQPFKARQYLLKATEETQDAEPHLLLAQLAIERLQTTPKDGHPGLITEAQGHTERAEAADPTTPGLTTMKAQLAALNGEVDKAEALLRSATEARPTDEESWLALFHFLLETKREREAMETLQAGIDAGAKGASVHHIMGMMMAEDGRHSEAIASLKRALEIDPTSRGGLRLRLAQLVRAGGDEAAAMALLREEIGLEGGQQRHARLLLAQMHLDSNTPGAARPLVDEVLDKDPSDQDALMIAYLIALKTGSDTAKAKTAALGAIGKRSTLAQVLLEQGFIDEGEVLLREAVVEEPDDPLSGVLLAALLLGTKRADEANKLKDEVLARTPEGEERDGLTQLFDAAFEQARQALAAQPPESPPTTP
jgi:tetratricopeptide (TPR) repeat protein